jgi:hypothetical protein
VRKGLVGWQEELGRFKGHSYPDLLILVADKLLC